MFKPMKMERVPGLYNFHICIHSLFIPTTLQNKIDLSFVSFSISFSIIPAGIYFYQGSQGDYIPSILGAPHNTKPV